MMLGPDAHVDLGSGDLTMSSGVGGMAGGTLLASSERIGWGADATFIQTGGTNTLVPGGRGLSVGYHAQGLYQLADGVLDTRHEIIGYYGEGTLVQTGGVHIVDSLRIGGRYSGDSTSPASGTIEISGGVLSAGRVTISCGAPGALRITDPSSQITVSQALHFGSDASLDTVPDSTIHMTGAALENESTDPAALEGLGNLTLVFEGGLEDVDPFEVAGQDMGPVAEGFELNFALDTLQLGGERAGRVELIDAFDNQPDWEGAEALYVRNLLFVGPGSCLQTNDLNVYYLNGGDPKRLFAGDCNLDGRVDVEDLDTLAANWSALDPTQKGWAEGDTNGDAVVDVRDLTALAGNWGLGSPIGSGAVPEPSVLGLIGLGGLVMLGRRRG